jgi:Na+-translocating ferredoxin:NAD+ oxidoreductase RNF subunit RnfB
MMLANILQLWNDSWPAGATMLLLGLGFAIVLLFASEKLKVLRDERTERVLAALPNINCGACGCAGCQEYAKAVVADATLLGKCFPG